MDAKLPLYDSLGLSAAQGRFPQADSLVNVYDVMDLDIILSSHPNWARISQFPPLFLHNNPKFILDSAFAADTFENEHINVAHLKFSDRAESTPDGHKQFYRLCLFSTADPTYPIAFGAMDIELLKDWQVKEQVNNENEFALRLEFLHNYVVPEFRELGLAKLLSAAMGDIFWHQLQHVMEQLEDTDFLVRPIIKGHVTKAGGSMILDIVEREMRMMSKLFAKEERDFRLEPTLIDSPEIAEPA
ncbi:hypothetical protein HR060_13100 [Catenovulum sp. SM1970]|uniref:hypothetical protein n=1 Tax=Marinifaba aquimaris TaxID=2741323 RepID=UPI0015747873|nr:hypothetical protein [Marinifaba aquimaris]NTS77795.1 hypothetical protein [Marinifaba aquimaris]